MTVPRRIPLHESYAVDPQTGCWNWTVRLDRNGYGVYRWVEGGRRRLRMAHRWVYEQIVGPLTDDVQLDHLCRNVACVNPEHMDPVTQSVNQYRSANGYGSRDRCKSGRHDITEPESWMWNSRGKRSCRECFLISNRAAQARRREARRLAQKRAAS